MKTPSVAVNKPLIMGKKRVLNTLEVPNDSLFLIHILDYLTQVDTPTSHPKGITPPCLLRGKAYKPSFMGISKTIGPLVMDGLLSGSFIRNKGYSC